MERQDMNNNLRLEAESLLREFQYLNLRASSSGTNQDTHVTSPGNIERYAYFPPNSNSMGSFNGDRLSSIHQYVSQMLGSFDHASSSRGGHVGNRMDPESSSYAATGNSVGRVPHPCIGHNVISRKIFDMITSKEGRRGMENYLQWCEYSKKVNLILDLTRDREVLVKAAKDKEGIEFVKKLIDIVKRYDELCEIVTSTFRASTHELMIHPTGCGLVPHCLGNLSYSQHSFLIDSAYINCFQLAKNAIGCTSLLQCIKACNYSDRQNIHSKIIRKTVKLATHAKGNYMLQHILEMGDDGNIRSICYYLNAHLEELSVDRHASYVIQKCLETFEGHCLIESLARCEVNQLKRLATDQYGNYVLQTALMTKVVELRDKLVRALRRLPREMEQDQFASNVFRAVRYFEQRRAHFGG